VAPVIDDARRRQRRRRIVLAALAVLASAGLAIGLAFATSVGGKSASPPARSASTRPRSFHSAWVQQDKVVMEIAADNARIMRMWCARGAKTGTTVWVARTDTFKQVRPAGLAPNCPSLTP
jgi:hypothetical protein